MRSRLPRPTLAIFLRSASTLVDAWMSLTSGHAPNARGATHSDPGATPRYRRAIPSLAVRGRSVLRTTRSDGCASRNDRQSRRIHHARARLPHAVVEARHAGRGIGQTPVMGRATSRGRGCRSMCACHQHGHGSAFRKGGGRDFCGGRCFGCHGTRGSASARKRAHQGTRRGQQDGAST